MTAIAGGIFRIATLEEKPGLLVAFLVEIMKELRIALRRQRTGEFVEAREQRTEVRLGIGCGHGLHLPVEFDQRAQDVLFRRGHAQLVAYAGGFHKTKFALADAKFVARNHWKNAGKKSRGAKNFHKPIACAVAVQGRKSVYGFLPDGHGDGKRENILTKAGKMPGQERDFAAKSGR